MRMKEALSLVEIMVALLIISVGLVGASSLFSVSLKAVHDSRVKNMSAQLAKDMMEEIFSNAWEDPNPAARVFGFEPLEVRCGITAGTMFDDIDDYNGSIETTPAMLNPQAVAGCVPMDGRTIAVGTGNVTVPNYRNFRRRCAVSYVTYSQPDPAGEPNLWQEAASAAATDYKRITITIEQTGDGDFTTPDYTFSLAQVVARP